MTLNDLNASDLPGSIKKKSGQLSRHPLEIGPYEPILFGRKSMWRETLQKLSSDLTFKAPALYAEIDQIESELGVAPPDELRSLLGESNGVEGEYGLGLLWDVERIIEDNRRFRTLPDFTELYMPFDCLLFFGDAGNGDQFAFPILGGTIRRPDIFVWNHEDDSRSWVAPSLLTYFEWWASGKLTV